MVAKVLCTAMLTGNLGREIVPVKQRHLQEGEGVEEKRGSRN